jgi:nucleoside-diphosphate-sugar epimerase
MRILVLGSTGFIGSAITDRLASSGHHVVALRRGSDRHSERDPTPRGSRIETRTGDLASQDSLRAAVTPDVDAVVHAAAPLGDWQRERQSVQVMLEALDAPQKVFVYLSGAWVLGPSSNTDGSVLELDETSPPNPIALVSGRESVESLVTGSPVTGVVIRPGIAFGRGGGIPAMHVGWAREHGHGRFVGAPEVTWPVIHVDDLAHLVELALRHARAGDLWHGVTQPAVPVAEVAAAADLAAGGSGVAEPWPLAEASLVLGAAFAEALATSQTIGSDRARAIGWSPEHVDIVRDLAGGSYAPRLEVS